jgi:hypothetical protein
MDITSTKINDLICGYYLKNIILYKYNNMSSKVDYLPKIDRRDILLDTLLTNTHNNFEIQFMESIRGKSSLTSRQKDTLDRIVDQITSRLFYVIKK